MVREVNRVLTRLLLKSIAHLTTNRRLLTVWIIFVAFFLWMSWLDNQLKAIGNEAGILDLQFAFTAERANDILAHWGVAGRQLALKGLLYDCLYPISYSLALLTLVVRVYGVATPGSRFFIRLPLLAVILDYSENYLHWRIIQAFPAITSSNIGLASYFAAAKWLLIAVTIGSILLTGAIRLKRRSKPVNK